MCRFLAYLGPPVTLESLLLRPEHSWLEQSWAPRFQVHGKINADGFGAGWYAPEVRPEPARYRRPTPMWTDRSFASLAGVVRSGAVLAAVRAATPPLPVEESGTQPFADGRWLFAHNGSVEGFTGDAGLELRRQVSERRLAGVQGAADSEVLFAMALDQLDAGTSPGAALAHVVKATLAVTDARLNLALTDGEQVAATAWGSSLFTLVREGAVVVASEPYDDGGDWRGVPDHSLVQASLAGVETAPL
jgi:glutamine amidotransferase